MPKKHYLYKIRVIGSGSFDIYVVARGSEKALEKAKICYPRAVFLTPTYIDEVII